MSKRLEDAKLELVAAMVIESERVDAGALLVDVKNDVTRLYISTIDRRLRERDGKLRKEN